MQFTDTLLPIKRTQFCEDKANATPDNERTNVTFRVKKKSQNKISNFRLQVASKFRYHSGKDVAYYCSDIGKNKQTNKQLHIFVPLNKRSKISHALATTTKNIYSPNTIAGALLV